MTEKQLSSRLPDQKVYLYFTYLMRLCGNSRKFWLKVGYSRNIGIQEKLLVPSGLFGVHNTETVVEKSKSGRDVLFFTLDLIKEKLTTAYALTDEIEMSQEISEIMDLCEASGNTHLIWFRRLLESHFEGIIAHATYRISTGKLEGINNKIKTLRRQGYGYPDDDYFFLKLFDASRKAYDRNPKSHKKND